VNPGAQEQRRIIPLGHISGIHGVSGWVKIHSLTDPREAIFDYQPWLLGERLEPVGVRQGKKHGRYLLALLEDIDDREKAEGLVRQQIAVFRDQLPDLQNTGYYWTDLIGLDVYLPDGRRLGKIERMLATGAHDVMVVQGERERLIPFVLDRYVMRVDLDNRRLEVDWDPEF
jgi:16S rRNA processing protein RimM